MAFKMKGPSLYKKSSTYKKESKSYEQAYKDRDMSTYGNLTQSEFTTEAKKQNLSKKLYGSYNAPTEQVKSAYGGGAGPNKDKPVTVKQTGTRKTTPTLPTKPSPPKEKETMTGNRKKQIKKFLGKLKRKKKK